MRMGTEKLAVLVNTFGSSLMTVSKEMGVEVSLVKSEIAQGVNVTGSCVAALVGIVGGGVQGTAVIMLDREGFNATVSAMSGGMITPDTEDAVSMSVIGELANMVSGNTSVWMTPALVANRSATSPGTAEACGVKPSRPRCPPSASASAGTRRSAISRMPSTPTSRMVPCKNSAGASMTTAPITAERPTAPPMSRANSTTATSAAASPPRLSVSWMA